jgi:hypothetical protein
LAELAKYFRPLIRVKKTTKIPQYNWQSIGTVQYNLFKNSY